MSTGSIDFDADVVIAAADLVGRTGATDFEIGYLNGDVPMAEAGWYAVAVFRGAKIIEEAVRPAEAAEALAIRLLTGAKCKCGRLVALHAGGAMAFNAAMADGTNWTVEEARAAGQCRWRRDGKRWRRGCEEESRSESNPSGRVCTCQTCMEDN